MKSTLSIHFPYFSGAVWGGWWLSGVSGTGDGGRGLHGRRSWAGLAPLPPERQSGFTQGDNMSASEITIIGDKDNPTRAQVYVDGNEVHGVKSVRYEHRACGMPEVEIELGGAVLDMNGMNVSVSETCRVTIKRA